MGKKVEIDLESLAAAISNTILSFTEDQEDLKMSEKALKEIEESGTVPWEEVRTKLGLTKKKRGRPRKCKESHVPNEETAQVLKDADEGKGLLPPISNLDELFDEPEEQILNEPVQPTNPTKSYIAPAKAQNKEMVGIASKTKAFQAPKGPNKFQDTGMLAVGDKIPAWKYPVPSERRDPVQRMRFTCSVCNRQWDDYPANVPQAFARFGDGKEAETAIVRCENCTVAIIQNKSYKDYS